MPALKTETIRLTEAQQTKLRLQYKGCSSFLFRELLDIFLFADKPGMDILSLRAKINGKLNRTGGVK
jgi:DNA repair protein RadC